MLDLVTRQVRMLPIPSHRYFKHDLRGILSRAVNSGVRSKSGRATLAARTITRLHYQRGTKIVVSAEGVPSLLISGRCLPIKLKPCIEYVCYQVEIVKTAAHAHSMADVVALKKNISVSGFCKREKMSCKFCHDPGLASPFTSRTAPFAISPSVARLQFS